MDRQTGTDADEDTPGRRLENYIKARWTRRQGGMRALATAIGSSAETMYSWFRGDAEPSLAHLRALADQLGVRRSVLVAVLDGDPLPGESTAPELDARLRSIEGVVSLLVRQSAEAHPMPPAPRDSAGSGR